MTDNLTTTVLYPDGKTESGTLDVISEHVLNVIINGQPSLKLVCTAENLDELVMGRLLTDGFIRSADDVDKMVFCSEKTSVRVFLNNEVKLEDRINTDKTCCTGNKVYMTNLNAERLQHLPDVKIVPEYVFGLTSEFAKGSKLHDATKGNHVCILASCGKTLFMSEDIGRHNAVDKVVGYALLNRISLADCMLFISGRVPVDMVEKVIAAGVPVLVSKSVPTKESAELARKYGLKLVCRAWPDKCDIIVS